MCREYGEVVLLLVDPNESLSKPNDEFGLEGSVEALVTGGLGAISLAPGLDASCTVSKFRSDGLSSCSLIEGRIVVLGVFSIPSSEGISFVSR